MRKTPTFWAAAVVAAITVPPVPASAQEAGKDRVKELVAQALQSAGQAPATVQPNQVLTPPSGPVTPLSADRMEQPDGLLARQEADRLGRRAAHAAVWACPASRNTAVERLRSGCHPDQCDSRYAFGL